MVSRANQIEIEIGIRDLASRDLKRFVGEVDQVGARSKQASRGVDRLGASTLRANAATKSLIASYRTLGGLGVAAGLIATARAGQQLSLALGEVSTIVDETVFSNERLAEIVSDLADTVGVDSAEAARGLYQTISAGATDAASAAKILEEGLQLGIAGLANTETAVDGLTSVLNSYQLGATSAERISDIFFTTVRIGKTTVEELAGSVGQVTPLANNLGVSFEEVAAGIASITKQGVSTSEAVTQLRSVFVALTKNADEVDAVFSRVGKSYDENTLKTEGLASVLGTLREATNDSQIELTNLLGRVEAVNGVLGLTGDNAQVFIDSLEQIEESSGATDAALEKIEKTSGRRLQRLWIDLKNSAAEVGVGFLDAAFDLGDGFGGALRGVGGAIDAVSTNVLEFFNVYSSGAKKSAQAVREQRDALVAFANEAKVALAEIEGLLITAFKDGERQLSIDIDLALNDPSGLAERFLGKPTSQDPEARFIIPVEIAAPDAVRFAQEINSILNQAFNEADIDSAASVEGLLNSPEIKDQVQRVFGDAADGSGKIVISKFRADFDENLGQFILSAELLRRVQNESAELGDEAAKAFNARVVEIGTTGFALDVGVVSSQDKADQITAGNEAILQRIALNSQLAVIEAEITGGLESQIASIEAQTLARQAATAASFANGDIELQQAEALIEAYSRLNDVRVADAKKAEETSEKKAKATSEYERAFAGNIDQLSRDLVNGEADFSKFAESVIKDLAQIAIRSMILKSLGLGGANSGEGGGLLSSFFAKGGIMPGNMLGSIPINAYAGGGVASSPQLALFGEGRGAEAFVPLPDGKNIPVKMDGGGGTTTINISVQSLDPSTATDLIRAQTETIATELAAAAEEGRYAGFSRSVVRGRR